MNDQTYVIICRRGFNRHICPLVKQQNLHCCECGAVGYILREPREKQAETVQEEKEEIKDAE